MLATQTPPWQMPHGSPAAGPQVVELQIADADRWNARSASTTTAMRAGNENVIHRITHPHSERIRAIWSLDIESVN
jgi:hypothetical protein